MLNQNSLKWILKLNWCKREEIYKFGSPFSSTFLIPYYLTQTKVPKSPKMLLTNTFLFLPLLIWSLFSLLYCSIICLVSSTSILFTILKTAKKIYAENYDNFHSLIEEIIHVSKTMLVCDATIMNPLLWHCYLNTSIIPFSSG